ncbi:MAG: NUDIX hydrolase [Candidatus Liptonbacteria bacterium]|nr:NUDIX hydrolase [Candidatus Liptonbacteria bacterium]
MGKPTLKAPVPGEIRTVIKAYGRHVYFQNFLLPNGQTIEYLLHGGGSANAVMILAITKAGNVIAVNQFRYGPKNFVLEVPGGNKKGAQSLEEALSAELMEETGYEHGELIWLSNNGVYFDPSCSGSQFAAALAIDCVQTAEPNPEPSEILETIEIPLKDWVAKIFRGEIRDSKTITTTFLALPRLGWKI